MVKNGGRPGFYAAPVLFYQIVYMNVDEGSDRSIIINKVSSLELAL